MGLFLSVSDGPDIGDEPEKASEEKVILVDVDNLDSVVGINLFSESQASSCMNHTCSDGGASCLPMDGFGCRFISEGNGWRCWLTNCDWEIIQ